jgi:hypothetical protein
MAKGTAEKANMGGEAYGKYWQAGVGGTYGKERKGTAEKTVPADMMGQGDSGSLQADLTSAAHSMYQAAVSNSGDKYGDRALTER